MDASGKKRSDRALPPTYHIEPAEPVFGLAAYRVRFSAPSSDLVIRSVRAARSFGQRVDVLAAGDDESITVYLNGPDKGLALLRYLTKTFRPEQHHGRVMYHTHAKTPQLVISFVDVDNADDLWAVAATLLGKIDIVMAATIEYSDDVKMHECLVELRPGVDAQTVWEMLHDEDVQALVVFDAHQAPPDL